ncbi:MAG: pilus assembly protein N-terminal domain-containing protein [Candidatus Omnitrophica bacterium]|nr:pilus assembly protein N-terminal domain-containing protein [Candidatus Omnitrophota bacterium]
MSDSRILSLRRTFLNRFFVFSLAVVFGMGMMPGVVVDNGLSSAYAAGASSGSSTLRAPQSVTVIESRQDAAGPSGLSQHNILPETWVEEIKMDEGQLVVVVGRSHLLRFKKSIGRVSVSEPEILDFLMLSPTELLLNARAQGAVNLIVWDTENRVSNIDVNVINDPTLLKRLLQKIDPKGDFEVYPSRDVFVVEGETSSVLKSKEIEDAANAFAEGSISLVRVKETKQILLQIRFIQVDQSQDFDFGLDFEHADLFHDYIVTQRFLPGGTHAQTGGDSNFTFTNPRTTSQRDQFDVNDDDVYSFHLFDNNTLMNGFIKAIEEKGIGKTIARPNLVVKDGEEASFLVGGEAAVVVSTNNDISVEFKEYGTRLTFKAEVLYDDRIRLVVEPEVSALDFTNGVTVNDIVIPSFTSTKVKTMVELGENQTFMIGGLLRQEMQETETGVPFLRRIPFFGRLFESTDKTFSDTELLVLVTPRFINPEAKSVETSDDEYDMLSLATKLQAHPVKDEQAEAIERYIQENKRYLEKPIKIETEVKSKKELKKAKKDQITKEKKEKEEVVTKSSSLKELEAALNSISRPVDVKKEPKTIARKPAQAETAKKDQASEQRNKGYLYRSRMEP